MKKINNGKDAKSVLFELLRVLGQITSFSVDVGGEMTVDEIFEKAFDAIGRFLNVRTMFHLKIINEGQQLLIAHEWKKEGEEGNPESHIETKINKNDIPWLFSKIESDGHLSKINFLSKKTAVTENDAEFLKRRNVNSVLFVPVFCNNILTDLIEFDGQENSFDPEVFEMLIIVVRNAFRFITEKEKIELDYLFCDLKGAEKELLKLYHEGFKPKEIAKIKDMQQASVYTLTSNMAKKLGVSGRDEIIKWGTDYFRFYRNNENNGSE